MSSNLIILIMSKKVAPWLKKSMPKETAESMHRFNGDSDEDSAVVVSASVPRKHSASTARSQSAAAAVSAQGTQVTKAAQAPKVDRPASNADKHAKPEQSSKSDGIKNVVKNQTARLQPSEPQSAPQDSDESDDESDRRPPKQKAPKGNKHSLDADAALTREEDHDLDICADDEPADDSDDDASDDEDFVNVTFEFYDPEPQDHWSIENFFRDYVDDQAEFPAQELAQAISNQSIVGTTIKTGPTEYPIGFMSVLNMLTHRDLPAIQLIREFMLRHCADAHKKRQLQKILDDGDVHPIGLILQDRVVNCPPQLMSHLHSSFLQDVNWAVEHESTPELQHSFKFEHYIAICRVYQDDESIVGAGPVPPEEDEVSDDNDDSQIGSKRAARAPKAASKKAKNSSARNSIADDGQGATFLKFEEEFYRDHATLTFTCPVNRINPSSPYADVPQARLVTVIAAENMPKIIAEITQAVEDE
jgi:hypothetical protein